MAEQWQIRRGTTVDNDAFTGAEGELTMDTEDKNVRIHDGITQGGYILAKKSDIPNDLFDFKWADHILDDVSWLRADTFSWQDGHMYEAAYNHLANDYNPEVSIPAIEADKIYERDATADREVGVSIYYAWKATDDSYVYTQNEVPTIGDDTYAWSGGTTVPRYIPIINYMPAQPILSTEIIDNITITYFQAEDGHKICMPDQEANIVSLYNAVGVAWYYLIDITNRRFKLPRTKFGFVGLHNAIGDYVEPGLPNITGEISNIQYLDTSASGAFKVKSQTARDTGLTHSGGGIATYGFDASRSNTIYGNSTTVQPPATEMYLYFYVGNFTRAALENTAGVTTEVLNNKADTTAVPDLVTPDFEQGTYLNGGTIYYADKMYYAIYSAGAGNERRLQISKNSDMSNAITIGEIWITSSGSIFFISSTIIPKGWYYRADSGLDVNVYPIG